jgi:ribonuclease HI
MFEFDISAVVDGGSRGNGAANEGYGSYVLSTRDGRKETVRLDLGTATNNEAEYRTLIAALKDLAGRIQQAAKSPSGYSLLVHTDSQLMVGQLTPAGRSRPPTYALSWMRRLRSSRPSTAATWSRSSVWKAVKRTNRSRSRHPHLP